MAQDQMARNQAGSLSTAGKRWKDFSERVERLKSYESLKPFSYPMKLWFGAGKPTRLFYFTKPAFIDLLWRRALFPKHWLAIERYSIPTQEAIDTLHLLVSGLRLPLVFVGDLRPLDLTVFALLRRGATNFHGSRTRSLPIFYAGIDDRWLALSDQFRRRGKSMPESRIDTIELEHVDLIYELAPDLSTAVGGKSWGLLKSGHDVMVEMTYNSGGYREGYLERLVAHLDGIAAGATRTQRRNDEGGRVSGGLPRVIRGDRVG